MYLLKVKVKDRLRLHKTGLLHVVVRRLIISLFRDCKYSISAVESASLLQKLFCLYYDGRHATVYGGLMVMQISEMKYY